MRSILGIFFSIFLIFLFLEILIGFPISLEHEPYVLPQPAKTNEIVDEKKIKSDTPATEFSSLTSKQNMTGVHFVESRKGSRDWELYAESANNEGEASGWILKKLRVFFYNEDKIEFIVTGDQGSIDPKTKDMKIEGNVVTKTSNGYVFNSQTIYYQAKDRSLRSPNQVSMISPSDNDTQGMKVTGDFLEAFIDDSKMEIKRNVKANKLMSDGSPLNVNSDIARFNGKNNSATFLGNVSINTSGMKLEGPEAQFDYVPGKDLLNSLVVKGGVRVSDNEKYATAENVRFDPETNTYTFNGHPRVVQNNDEILGDKIVFIDGGKRVKVEKIKAKVENSKQSP